MYWLNLMVMKEIYKLECVCVSDNELICVCVGTYLEGLV